MRKPITFIILVISIITSAQNIDFGKIDVIINSKIEEKDPSLFVGIVKNGNIIYEKYRGLANLQHQVKVDEKSRSNIASTAKQFTALMILQLSLEEKLSLEEDIRKYLPKLYPEIKESIKIRHLLNHTSGIRDYADLMSIQRKPWWKQVGMDNDDVIELLERQEDLNFKPGLRYMYSNSEYSILAKIIEVASEEKFHKYSAQFFKELGMNETSFSKNYMNVISNVALPYSDWGNGVWKQYPMLTNLYGDGFLYTTLRDQLLFEQAVQNAKRNHNILLIESQKPIPKSEIKTYGFGLELGNRLNYKAIHHSGSTGSYHSQMVRYPEERLTVFVMSSNSRIWSGFIADEIANTILPKKKELTIYDSGISNTGQKTPLKNLVGQYMSPDEDIISIQLKEDELYWKMDNNNPIQLQYENDNLYSIVGNPATKIGFEVNNTKNNKLTVFWPDSRKRVYSVIPLFQPTKEKLKDFEGDYYSKELDVNFNISLDENEKLSIKLKGRKRAGEVEVINKNDLLFSDYKMKVERDASNRVTAILVTTNRILNNKFIKK